MITENFEAQTSRTLNRRRNFSKVAIILAIGGAFFAIGAATYKYNEGAELVSTTIWLSIIAILVTIPVVLELRKISKILGRRKVNLDV